VRYGRSIEVRYQIHQRLEWECPGKCGAVMDIPAAKGLVCSGAPARAQVNSTVTTDAMSGNDSTPSDLKKLTVPQLKALCKERRIPGYSKLAKAALIQKLTECAGPPSQGLGLPPSARADERSEAASSHQEPLVTAENSTVPPVVGTIDNSVPTPSTASILTLGLEGARYGPQPVPVDPVQVECIGLPAHSTPILSPASDLPLPLAKSPRVASQKSAVGRKKRKVPASSIPGHDVSSSTSEELPVFKVPALPSKVLATQPTVSQVGSDLGGSTTSRKRPSSESTVQDSNSEVRKRPRLLAREEPPADAPTSSFGDPIMAESLGAVPRQTTASVKQVAPPARKRTVPPHKTTPSVSAARFKPLLINQSYTPSPASQPHVRMDNSSRTSDTITSMPVPFLDFTNSPVISLSPIPMPLSLSQRKRVPRWAIVFSRLPMRDLAVCAQVSRTFRYAGTLQFLYTVRYSLHLQCISQLCID
jgi:hypothetical protein